MQALIVIIATIAIIATFLIGRSIYKRSARLRNSIQMARIFTNISHELLTPLTVLSASVERMRDQEPKFSTDYALMQMNIERMVHLLQQILETSKSLNGSLKLLVSQGDVMEYITQTALSLEPLMSRRHHKFTIQCMPKSMMGWIDTDKIDKIIYNLLSNAAKYTNDGGQIMLQVRTNYTYDHITIKVIDNGIGISEDKKKHLFQRFYDGDYRRMSTRGTGLGLALTRDLVYLHRGTISCESEEGKGTTFTIELPISKESFLPEQVDEKNKVSISTSRSAILDLNKLLPEVTPPYLQSNESPHEDAYTLLLVEDNLDLLVLMQQLLSNKYHILTAKNGIEALEVIKKTKVDLIISDVMMPEMDGNELTLKLKSDPLTMHLPIILLTAKTQEEERQESLRIGADDYMTKPFRLGDLKLRIDNIIENRKRLQDSSETANAEEAEKEQVLTPEEEFMLRATTCVNNHIADADFNRETFALEMGASASTLYNKLRQLTGKNVSTFIRDIRLKEARRIALSETGIRVSDLAYRVGFSDPKYFATCFKKEFGMQPSEFIGGQGEESSGKPASQET